MKKLFIISAIVFLVLAIGSGAFFYLKWDSTKNEKVEKETIDAGQEPEAPAFPWWRAAPYPEYQSPAKVQILEDEYQASVDELAAYNQKKTQLEQQAETDYQSALKSRNDKADTGLKLMIISISVCIVLAFVSLLLAYFAGKKGPG